VTRAIFVAAAMLAPLSPLAAQLVPTPGLDTPRIQKATWQEGEAVLLTALPETALTVMLEPGEMIERVSLKGDPAWQFTISAEADSFQVTPLRGALPANVTIDSDRRSYSFALEVGEGLQAAYLVRLTFGSAGTPPPVRLPARDEASSAQLFRAYRLKGDRSVRPLSISDDGHRTVIEYAPDQALPAVFAIGPTGAEEVVDGHMRDGRFVIDRVHAELVFRIDKAKATATRLPGQDKNG
jgi:type IV secretion system protein VirB9